MKRILTGIAVAWGMVGCWVTVTKPLCLFACGEDNGTKIENKGGR